MIPALLLAALAVRSGADASTAPKCTDPLKPEPIFQFPGDGAIAENLAVRPNGKILATLFVPQPELYEIDPTIPDLHSSGACLKHWTAQTNLFGITEVAPDVYQVIAGNVTGGAGVRGSVAIYEIDCKMAESCQGAPITHLLDIPETGGLDGLTTLDFATGLSVAGDVATGSLYVIDRRTRTAASLYTGAALQPLSQNARDGLLTVGVNGLRVLGNYLYFTSTAKGLFGRIDLAPETHLPIGPVQVLDNYTSYPIRLDDFALDATGNAFLAAEAETPGIYLRSAGVGRRMVARTQLFANTSVSTAAAFGRLASDVCTLYVLYGDETDTTASKLGRLEVRDSPLYMGKCPGEV